MVFKYVFQNSHYNPENGRFLSEDPVDFWGGFNLYTYAGNNTINFKDPFGLYGTNSCEYYEQRCLESGGKYYCKKAPAWCDYFRKPPDPDPTRDDDYEGFSRCTRQCLQDCDKEKRDESGQNSCPLKPDPSTDEFLDLNPTGCHAYCYYFCGRLRTNPPAYTN